jgi:hypothetical protein
MPVSDTNAIKLSGASLHSQGTTEPGPSATTASHRTGQLIAFLEDKSLTSDNLLCPYSPFSHRRAGLLPALPTIHVLPK